MMVLRRAGILFLFLLFLTYTGAAQRPTDTVEKLDTTVADTIVVGGSVSPATEESVLDTSTLEGAGREMGSGDQDAVSLRTVPDSVIDVYKKDRRFAYANDPAYWRRQPEEPNKPLEWLFRLLSSSGFRYFILIALGGLLLFVIIRIMSENNLHVFYRRRTRKTGGDGTDEAPVEEDLDERLRHYLGLHDHRQAVRYLYLRSLRGLNHQGLITRTLQATNHEYLRQLSGTAQERPFSFLTTAYEKVWYGEFALGESQFQRLYQHFVDFDKTVLA